MLKVWPYVFKCFIPFIVTNTPRGGGPTAAVLTLFPQGLYRSLDGSEGHLPIGQPQRERDDRKTRGSWSCILEKMT